MAKKLYPTDTLKEAQNIITAWYHIGRVPIMGHQGYENLRTNLENVTKLKEKIIRLEAELIQLRNERDAACIEIWQQVKRVRAGIIGMYGDDSSEYELAGGNRLSERKRPQHKVATTPE